MSRDSSLEVIVEKSDSGRGELLVKSPSVGMYGGAPKAGEVLVGRSRVGRLTSLGRTVSLIMPRGTLGRVAERMLHNRRDPVDYGQVLLRLVPVEQIEVGQGTTNEDKAALSGLPEGSYAITSPTHGIFYRRPRPDEPPYVEEGQVVEEGTTMALVEVMKCFSAITYGGTGLPSRAEVVEVRTDDNAEIQSDQILFVVRPA
jgi:acetyl-CoA carboxylase biotin carboxyl carrier protein